MLLEHITQPQDIYMNCLILSKIVSEYTPYFEEMVSKIYPTEHQLKKANSLDTESKKRAKIRNHHRSPSYGVYISQLIRFPGVCSNVSDFNDRMQFLTA